MLANEQRAYALTDRGTWLAMSSKTPALRLLIGGSRLSDNRDQDLRNTYGVMVVNPDTHPGVKHALATRFVRVAPVGRDTAGHRRASASHGSASRSTTRTPTSTRPRGS